MIRAVLFDLDGVITDTALFHYQAWKALTNKLGGDISEEFNEKLKGVDRKNSLKIILDANEIVLSDKEFNDALIWKNNLYTNYLDQLNEEHILAGIEEFMKELKEAGIKIVIASASKNAPYIISRLNLGDFVYAIASPDDVENNKPAPDIFLLAATLANVDTSECIGIEDAQAGIDALNSANIKSIAIGKTLNNADINLENTNELSLQLIKNNLLFAKESIV